MTITKYIGLCAAILVAAPWTSVGAADGVVKIGAAVSLTGQFSREGELLKNGYELWKETVNSNGGIQVGDKTYEVQITYYDDESKPQTSAKLTERLITEDQVDFLMGPYSSGIATATAAISERYRKITIAPMATANSIYTRGYKYIFTPSPLGHTGLFPVLEMAKGFDPMPKRLAIVGPDDLFPNITADGAEEYAKELGYEVVYRGKYPKGAVDLSAVATAVKAAEPDIVLCSGYVQDSILLVKTMSQLQVRPKLIGLATAIGVEDLRNALGSDAEGLVGVDYWVPTLTYSGQYFKDSMAFASAFEEFTGVRPTYHAASGTAAGVILEQAIEKAGSLDSDKVREVLLSVTGETFYGPYGFNEQGVNELATLSVSQIIGGEPLVVFPEAVAQEPPAFPLPAE